MLIQKIIDGIKNRIHYDYKRLRSNYKYRIVQDVGGGYVEVEVFKRNIYFNPKEDKFLITRNPIRTGWIFKRISNYERIKNKSKIKKEPKGFRVHVYGQERDVIVKQDKHIGDEKELLMRIIGEENIYPEKIVHKDDIDVQVENNF